MFTRSPIHTKLDEKILAALTKLDHYQSDSEEYKQTLDNIAKLQQLKTDETQTEIKIEETLIKVRAESRLQLPDTNTLLLVGANIFGILWLTRYEREHVISSKALGFVIKHPR